MYICGGKGALYFHCTALRSTDELYLEKCLIMPVISGMLRKACGLVEEGISFPPPFFFAISFAGVYLDLNALLLL